MLLKSHRVLWISMWSAIGIVGFPAALLRGAHAEAPE